ncbi:MAG: PRD domain-containing protein, partial [Tetragenococcus koreensis]|nr:PRD domain-containing protein [Tetragenococcus koreensis]
QRNKGVWFDLTDVEKITLKNELLVTQSFDVYPDQTTRVSRILMQLLMTNDLLTIDKLADFLSVSKNTIVTDLEKVDLLAETFQVKLSRSSGYGLSVQGKEEDLRYLIEHLLQSNFTEYDIYIIMNQLVNPKDERTSSINLGKNDLFQSTYTKIINELSLLLNPTLLDQFNYTELLSISLRSAISVCRLSLHQPIGSLKLLNDQEKLIQKKSIPFLIMKKIFEQYDLPLLEEEYKYIASNYTKKGPVQDSLDLTNRLIKDVTEEISIPFIKDHQLLTNLFAHLSLRLSKKYQFINEYNPFVDDIKKKYPDLFNAVLVACRREIVNLGVRIDESFVAYIALHFLASLEKQKQEVIRVVYICSTGLGVTNLIQQRIYEEIGNVEIIGFASVLNADEVIKEKKPDLVISIFPIESDTCPVIKVNAIPSKDDIQKIKSTVDYLLANNGGIFESHLKQTREKNEFKNSEKFSQDLIVKGYIIYEGLLTIFKGVLKDDYLDAFLLHVFLMVHRITFDIQYDPVGNVDKDVLISDKQLLLKVEQLFAENDLSVNDAELTALFQYIDI